MAQIALAKTFMGDLVRLDRGLQRKVQEMIGRLQRDHTAKGLQLERYNAAEDPGREPHVSTSTRERSSLQLGVTPTSSSTCSRTIRQTGGWRTTSSASTSYRSP